MRSFNPPFPAHWLAWSLAGMLFAAPGGILAAENNPLAAPPNGQPVEESTPKAKEANTDTPAVTDRLKAERDTKGRFTITTHKPNYLLPFTWWSDPNQAAYAPIGGKSLEAQAAKFQLSIKVPIMDDVFSDRSSLWFGYTQTAWWQLYNPGENDDVSRPFRETNHEPELMLDFITDFEVLGMRNRLVRIGLSHQSNGQSRPLSRSWNRIYAVFLLEWNDVGIAFKPWYRIPESAEQDDNPDIIDYMGHFDITAAWRNGEHEYSLKLRRNFATGNGAIELGYSFPLNGRVRGFVQVFHGYGESLIDYNHKATRIGIGVLIAGWL
ncbi:MAG TPA: phospholipase A [Gammaproteobacteria bacterium]|nr:phospholipase A [Gammaproteobacteria bacterium]